GSVTLSVDGGPTVSGTLSGGIYLFDVGTLNAGSHSLSASYAAQGNFAASSATGSLFVNQAATSVGITAPVVLTYNANSSVTVTVTSPAGTPTGNVSLTLDGGTPVAQALSGGSATFTLTSPFAGFHLLSASYAVQGNFAASTATGTIFLV